MRERQKKEAEKRAKYFLWFTIAKIFSEVMIILGFFIFAYFLIRSFI